MLFCALVLWAASVTAAAVDPPRVVSVAPVAPNVLELRVACGVVTHGRQAAYVAAPGDVVERPSLQERWVVRDGEYIGGLVGTAGDILMPFDRFNGELLDPTYLDATETYLISSPTDQAFVAPLHPSAVHRKTGPTDLGRVAPWEFAASLEHALYLVLPSQMTPGAVYTITFSNGRLPDTDVAYRPSKVESPAVHVSQIGFRPDDPAKVAFLSCWMGSGGGLGYGAGLEFAVVDSNSERVLVRGETRLAKPASEPSDDAYGRNYNGTDVYELDFSSLRRAGRYRVCVEGVGCSHPFAIGTDVWLDAFVVSARGLYHQRSGIALGPPYTGFQRPRPFHPDDGVVVHASTARLIDTGNGLNADDTNFGNLVAGLTDGVVPDAWGGTMDAGDWDRRIQHLQVSLLLLELAELFPGYFEDADLRIPESGDSTPDIVDEALFNLDCYRRMQTPEGGIRGGIESAEHPRFGEASWQESLEVIAYAPGAWSSYLYAGVAARAVGWLRAHDPARSEVWVESALRAMRWAEAQPSESELDQRFEVRDARNFAAAELYRLTGDPEWHAVFKETTALDEPGAELFVWGDHEQRNAAWAYLETTWPEIDPVLQQRCRDALLSEADARALTTTRTGFRWTKYEWMFAGLGVLSSPDGLSLARAHALTGDDAYLRALVLASQTGAGANPLNLSYTTGVGWRSPAHALNVDARVSNQPPPPGLTVFGPLDPALDLGDDWDGWPVRDFVDPPIERWPAIEAFWDVFWDAPRCEYTVRLPMATNAYVWGYLAARGRSEPPPRAPVLRVAPTSGAESLP